MKWVHVLYRSDFTRTREDTWKRYDIDASAREFNKSSFYFIPEYCSGPRLLFYRRGNHMKFGMTQPPPNPRHLNLSYHLRKIIEIWGFGFLSSVLPNTYTAIFRVHTQSEYLIIITLFSLYTDSYHTRIFTVQNRRNNDFSKFFSQIQ